MSQRQQSTAAVIRVKGVSFNYLQFLWSSIGTIRRTHEQGNFAGALKLATDLIVYLPESIKDEFREKAAKINYSFNQIRAGRILEVQKIADFYIRGIFKNRLLQTYGNAALQQFVDELTTKLDKIGYMENIKTVAEGTAEQEGTWMEIEEKQGKKITKKRKTKGEARPTGSMD